MAFRKPKRSNRKVKVGLIGPTFSGKTIGALLIAKGLGGKTGLIDTEGGRGELYEGKFDYEYDRIEAPYEPSKYVDSINYAKKAGFNNVIPDSLSHAWDGAGGIQTQHQKATGGDQRKAVGAWNPLNEQHRQLTSCITNCGMNVIATFRAKDKVKTETVTNQNNSTYQKVVKDENAANQRDDMLFDFDIVFQIDKSNMATCIKDVPDNLFLGKEPFKITEQTGQQIAQWLNPNTTNPPAASQQPSVINTKPMDFLDNELEAMMKVMSPCHEEIMKQTGVDVTAKQDERVLIFWTHHFNKSDCTDLLVFFNNFNTETGRKWIIRNLGKHLSSRTAAQRYT